MSIFQNTVFSESQLLGPVTAKTLLGLTEGTVTVHAGPAVHSSLPSHKRGLSTGVCGPFSGGGSAGPSVRPRQAPGSLAAHGLLAGCGCWRDISQGSRWLLASGCLQLPAKDTSPSWLLWLKSAWRRIPWQDRQDDCT